MGWPTRKQEFSQTSDDTLDIVVRSVLSVVVSGALRGRSQIPLPLYLCIYEITATNVRCVIPPISLSRCSNLSGMPHDLSFP